MDTARSFIGRKEHRHQGHVHFGEVTVRAEPRPGESRVILSEAVLSTLRDVFGEDFDHQRHCVWSAVSAQLSTINVAGHFPHAGALSFRVEVVDVRVSGNAGREVSGFLLSVAGMDAIGEYLSVWEAEQKAGAGETLPASPNAEVSCSGPALESEYEDALNRIKASLTEEDVRRGVYQSAYARVWNDLNNGLTRDEIQKGWVEQLQMPNWQAELVREALEDALAGLPSRYNSRPFP